MSVVKFISLVPATSAGPSGSEMVEAIAAEWRASGDRLPVEGLIVGELLDQVSPGLEVAVTVQWWAEETLDVDAVTALLGTAGGTTAPGVPTWRLREHVYRRPGDRLRPGTDPERVNLFGTARRRADFDQASFFRYWDEVHAPISARTPGLRGYVASEVLDRHSGDLDIHGFVELWWPDRATFEASGDTPEQAAAWEDVGNYAETTGTFWVTREHVLVPPPETGPGSQDDLDA